MSYSDFLDGIQRYQDYTDKCERCGRSYRVTANQQKRHDEIMPVPGVSRNPHWELCPTCRPYAGVLVVETAAGWQATNVISYVEEAA